MTKQLPNFTTKLRNSGLRPTKQRKKICEVLFNREKTFHFSINDLMKILENQSDEKISLATIYNCLNQFTTHKILKSVRLSSDKVYFDTNTQSHHHFYDEQTKELVDINSDDVEIKKIPTPPSGKKIIDAEVTFKISIE